MMVMNSLSVPHLFDGETFHQNMTLYIEQGVIVDIKKAQNTPSTQTLLVPGFIDIQVNGGGGALFNQTPTLATIKKISQSHQAFGTTAMLPTLITDNLDAMKQAAEAIAQAIQLNLPGIIGVHFEGPHLSITKKGAHNATFIRALSEEEMHIFTRQDLGKVMLTLAPESVTLSQVKQLKAAGITLALGHSNTHFDTASQYFKAGVTGTTHLFNAMSALTAREPGLLGAALMNEDIYASIIVDGHHVHEQLSLLALALKPKGKLFLITDAMSPVGSEEVEFTLSGKKVWLKDGQLRSETGELAGSVLDMATAVRNVHHTLKQPLEEALRMASTYPAKFIGLEHKLGMLKPGYQADMLLLDKTNLTVTASWIAGQPVF